MKRQARRKCGVVLAEMQGGRQLAAGRGHAPRGRRCLPIVEVEHGSSSDSAQLAIRPDTRRRAEDQPVPWATEAGSEPGQGLRPRFRRSANAEESRAGNLPDTAVTG